MVEQVLDPLRPSVLSLSGQELDDISALIEAGQLPADYIERCKDAADANVHGVDAPRGRDGRRQEQGRARPVTKRARASRRTRNGARTSRTLSAP